MEQYKTQFKQKADTTIQFLEGKLAKLHATGANPAMLSGIQAEYHGTPTPLQSMATIRVQDALSMLVVPFEQDKKVTKAIAEAIAAANIGVTATDEGNQVRIGVPPVTQEKREEYVKEAKEFTEEAKIAIRNVRQDVMKSIDNNDDLSDDMKRDAKDAIQTLVDEYNAKIDAHFKTKETDLMTV
jgi:ribosome recycling factor